MVKVAPLGKSIRNPDPSTKSSGCSVSSEYRNVDATTDSRETVIKTGNLVPGLGGVAGDSVVIAKPSRVRLETYPDILTFIDRSPETNQTNAGIASLTNRSITRTASLSGIMFDFIAEECGPIEAAYWCEKLDFMLPEAARQYSKCDR